MTEFFLKIFKERFFSLKRHKYLHVTTSIPRITIDPCNVGEMTNTSKKKSHLNEIGLFCFKRANTILLLSQLSLYQL